MAFLPRVYKNNRPLLTAADLDNHPRAQEYIDYTRYMKYPDDFKTWLRKKETAEQAAMERDKHTVAGMLADPYCRSPSKIRIHKR